MTAAGPLAQRLAREVLARDLTDPLWPGLTESDWAQDAKVLAAAVLERADEPGSAPVTGVWLCGGENEVSVRVEVDGRWLEVIREFMPLHGNDGNVWPISHIAEIPAALDSAPAVSASGQTGAPE